MPPGNFDTVVSSNDSVYVKFYDHEILPRYVVYFEEDDVYGASSDDDYFLY